MHNACHARLAAGRRAHPFHVVVAPLDIHRVVAHQLVQDHIRPRAAIEDIAHNVQTKHGHTLDELRERKNKIIRAADVHDGIDDAAVVKLFVVILKMRMQQLV